MTWKPNLGAILRHIDSGGLMLVSNRLDTLPNHIQVQKLTIHDGGDVQRTRDGTPQAGTLYYADAPAMRLTGESVAMFYTTVDHGPDTWRCGDTFPTIWLTKEPA